MCSNVFKNMVFSNLLWIYNTYAGYSGLQCLEDMYYAVFNVNLTVQAMGMVMLVDQTISFAHSAQTTPGKPGDYALETQTLGFSVAQYYLFNKNTCIKPIMLRLLIWSAYSFFTGWVCYYIAFQSYGLGIANKDGKTEDLYTASLSAVMSIVVLHHVQIF